MSSYDNELLKTGQNLITEFQYDSLGNVTGIKRASGTTVKLRNLCLMLGSSRTVIGYGGSRVYFDEQGLAIVHVQLQGGRRDKCMTRWGN